MSLENRVAVITGAAGGLGRVVTKVLAERGTRLALLGTNIDRLNDLVRGLQLSDDRVLAVAADLGDADATKAAAEAVTRKFGRAEILLHFVGGWVGGTPVTEVAASVVDDMLQQHLWTTFNVAQAFVPSLVANGWGRILAISSPNAANPLARGLPYAVGKAAQETLILTLAEELKDTGVTANVLRVRAIDVKHERDRARTAKNEGWTSQDWPRINSDRRSSKAGPVKRLTPPVASRVCSLTTYSSS